MCTDRPITPDAGMTDLQQPASLQPADVMVVRSVLHSLAHGWVLDEHHDADDGALMLMLTPPGPEDTTPTFVLSRTANGVQVTAILSDSCDTLHTAPNIRHATWAVLRSYNGSSGLLSQTEADIAQG